ncbi:ribonuclease H-like domain-containing protein [Mycolicibacterium fallax]|uniref:YprB ribonuclease H-like domain-containing protein n=1 Tax=Mycolicibacterium fallax TaxID=1793 RepID=A0A1X1RBE6_MYCFA|nr:ribonuclease H-like domain-containing protein [Mycolicibacterium fallax]ORV02568.1 hypothetical protein AWC04_11595 [Mycolicibacterium fallax]BBY98726.1 hypothetical protein MFAL_21930 [Mycolicibacterium fallax]HOW93172.1 ribonuclease H-like domain-containing protein [Mycolicibacterium fallax]
MAEIILGGYPAKRCARRTHNAFDPTAPPLGPADAGRQALIEAGLAFEAVVVDAVRRALGDTGQLRVIDEPDWAQATAATLAAIAERVPVIAGARLPNRGGRSGAPDLLVHRAGGYLPVEVKNHKVLTSTTRSSKPKSRSAVLASALGAPAAIHTVAGFGAKPDRRRDDGMQLAHYTRMLQDLGCHPGGGTDDPELLLGGIIGTSDLHELLGAELGILWHRLGDPPGSVLARYDEEFDLRLRVARAAAAGGELVRPVRIPECGSCDWFAHCAQVVADDDASFALQTGQLSLPEWRYLYTAAGDGSALTVAQLAAVDVEAQLDGFAAVSGGGKPARARLAGAVRRARMTLDGQDVEPRGAHWPTIPSADVEVDFDIEWDTDERIYQWGIRIRDGHHDAGARYEPVVSFRPLDDAAEAALAEEFAARLERLRAAADRDGKSLSIYHWSAVEITRSARFPRVAAALSGVSVDLCAWFKREFFARTSSSIKAVAPLFGFDWGDADAGGLTAQARIEQARGSGPDAAAARDWCLRYNRDDVAAQAAIRDGLRRLGAAAGPP